MSSYHRENIIYLLGASLLFYVGIFFMPQISMPLLGFSNSGLKFLNIFIIFFNSLILYFYLEQNKKQDHAREALVIGILYILCPIHLDVFIFDFQFLAIFAETALLLFIYFYGKRKLEFATVFIFLGTLLNSKLIIVSFFLLFDKKIKLFWRILLLSAIGLIGIYSVPFFHKVTWEAFLERVFYYFEKIFFPFQYLFLDDSLLISGLYSWLGMIAILLCLLAILFQFKIKWTPLFIIGILLLFYWPNFHLESFKVPTVYFLGSLYSGIVIGILLIIFNVTNGRIKRLFYPVCIFLALLWGGSLLSFQYKAVSLEAIWLEALARLPVNSKFEEPLKYEYASILIFNNKKKEANFFIKQNRKNNFKKEAWDYLLIQTEL